MLEIGISIDGGRAKTIDLPFPYPDETQPLTAHIDVTAYREGEVADDYSGVVDIKTTLHKENVKVILTNGVGGFDLCSSTPTNVTFCALKDEDGQYISKYDEEVVLVTFK